MHRMKNGINIHKKSNNIQILVGIKKGLKINSKRLIQKKKTC